MARAKTTSDVYNAIAEPKRRSILMLLKTGEKSVNDIVFALHFDQPSVSKHLTVLKEVGLVDVRKDGKQRMYKTNGQELKKVHDWTKQFEQFWDNQLTNIKTRAEKKSRRSTNKKGK